MANISKKYSWASSSHLLSFIAQFEGIRNHLNKKNQFWLGNRYLGTSAKVGFKL